MNHPESITKYMATKLITFKPDEDIRAAMKTIVGNKISGGPVVDEQGNLIGMLSEKDCIRAVVEAPYDRNPGGSGRVGDFMTTAVKTIAADKNVMDAAFEFAFTQYRRMPVVDNGRLVGQISRRDVLRAAMNNSPSIKHIPSSWAGRAPQVSPSKQGRHNMNA